MLPSSVRRKPCLVTQVTVVVFLQIFMFVVTLIMPPSSLALEPRSETCVFGSNESIPIYVWMGDESRKPAALLVAVHGMTLHGRRFDHLANELCADNVAVVSADLRGFGARQNLPAEEAGRTPVHYRRSEAEFVEVCRLMRNRYPNTPLFLLGESLGANLAIDIASAQPTLVDGIIACSPCVRRVQQLSPHMVADVTRGVIHPYQRISLRPYIAVKLSDDPQVVRDYLNDPLVRCDLTFAELWKSLGANKRSLQSMSRLPAQLPVLIIAGERDRIYSSRSLKKFVTSSGSKETELDIENNLGHLLVEHPFVAPEVLAKIRTWLHRQCPTLANHSTVSD